MIFLLSIKIPNCIVVKGRTGLPAGILFKKLYKNISIYYPLACQGLNLTNFLFLNCEQAFS